MVTGLGEIVAMLESGVSPYRDVQFREAHNDGTRGGDLYNEDGKRVVQRGMVG